MTKTDAVPQIRSGLCEHLAPRVSVQAQNIWGHKAHEIFQRLTILQAVFSEAW